MSDPTPFSEARAAMQALGIRYPAPPYALTPLSEVMNGMTDAERGAIRAQLVAMKVKVPPA